jgi:hypothetical protein
MKALAPFAILAPVLAVACGGAPSPGAASAADTPGAKCIALADVKLRRKPNEPDKVSVKHVLVKYAGAKNAPDSITRTREQACLRAQEALDKLKAGTAFADVVASYSDESGAATREGSIGAIERTDVAPAFADAAFLLGIREVSDVVESPFGFHIIYRTE